VLPIYLNGQKYDTRIPGLPVVPNSKEVLTALYAKITKMCEQYGLGTYYNQYMTEQVKYRWDIVNKYDDVYKIEDEIGLGQMEQLIDWAKGDLETVFYYNEVLVPAHMPGVEDPQMPDTTEEDDEDVWEGEGVTVTLDNVDELMAAEAAANPDFDADTALDEPIEGYNAMVKSMKEREIKMEAEAAEYGAEIDDIGGGWRMGS